MKFSPTDRYFMSLALDEAHKAYEENEIPVGCVIAAPGKEDGNGGMTERAILARAHNESERRDDVTAHAEALALSRAGRRALRGATLYVTLEPCPMCAGAIALSGVERVVYGAPDPACGCCGSVYRLTEDPAFPHFCRADGGLLKEECAQILERGFQKLRGKDGH